MNINREQPNKFYIAAAGDRPNDKVVKCKICRSNGFPHEPISVSKTGSGRIKNEGLYEFERYEVLNYFNGSKHEHRRRVAADQTYATNIHQVKRSINDHIWSKAAIKDELVYQLSSKTTFDWAKLTKQLEFEIPINWDEIQIHQKYHDRAEFVLCRINTWDPVTPPIFVINASDLTRSLRAELEDLQNTDPRGFERVVTEAVQTLFDGINARYYHTICTRRKRVGWLVKAD